MKRVLLILITGVVLLGLTACAKRQMYVGTCDNCPETCRSVAPCAGGAGRARAANDPVPPSGAVTYPYYTLHGPRDFLAPNPRPIGP